MVFEHDFEKFPELSNKQLETLQFTSPHTQIVEDFRAEIVRVHDGDTVTLRTVFRDFDFPLRLLDIDAPELNAGGAEAREWLRSRVLGKTVQIKINPKQRVGKFGRLLGKIFHAGMDIGEELLYAGLAKRFGTLDEFELPKIERTYNIRQWL